jgi:hypothetical protein
LKKYLLLLWLLMVPVAASALSCPTNGSIIEQGDTVQEVLARCGSPADQEKFLHKTPVTHGMAYNNGELTYGYVITHNHETVITELSYNGSRLGPSILRFEDGKMISWE